ncbi:hypothetical protein NPIL_296931 [Nephila pilipes]|uniref:Uncharacterized protein n=1 Tax=Nephila pilipes TaxID=299642 RepID=A0A8X6PQQ6_NEPPI|nr:hypothetical protein NPIL_296931 [Nephila pilipes]
MLAHGRPSTSVGESTAEKIKRVALSSQSKTQVLSSPPIPHPSTSKSSLSIMTLSRRNPSTYTWKPQPLLSSPPPPKTFSPAAELTKWRSTVDFLHHGLRKKKTRIRYPSNDSRGGNWELQGRDDSSKEFLISESGNGIEFEDDLLETPEDDFHSENEGFRPFREIVEARSSKTFVHRYT